MCESRTFVQWPPEHLWLNGSSGLGYKYAE